MYISQNEKGNIQLLYYIVSGCPLHDLSILTEAVSVEWPKPLGSKLQNPWRVPCTMTSWLVYRDWAVSFPQSRVNINNQSFVHTAQLPIPFCFGGWSHLCVDWRRSYKIKYLYCPALIFSSRVFSDSLTAPCASMARMRSIPQLFSCRKMLWNIPRNLSNSNPPSERSLVLRMYAFN